MATPSSAPPQKKPCKAGPRVSPKPPSKASPAAKSIRAPSPSTSLNLSSALSQSPSFSVACKIPAPPSATSNSTSIITSITPSAPELWVPHPAVFRVRSFLCLFASIPLYFLTSSQNPLQSAQSAASTSSPASDAPDALRTRPAPPCPQISSRPPTHIRRLEEKYSSPPRSPAPRGSAPAAREFPPPLAASAPPSRPASIETQTCACT